MGSMLLKHTITHIPTTTATFKSALTSPSVPVSRSAPSGKKSSKTCCTCRSRKVKCDGRRQICSNCERLGFSCSYDELTAESTTTGTDSSPTFTLPRRRVRNACLNCNNRKARCSGTTPKCTRCSNQGLNCVYRLTKRMRPSSANTTYNAGTPMIEEQDSHSSGASGEGNIDIQSPRSRRTSVPTAPLSKASPNSRSCIRQDTLNPSEHLVTWVLETFFRHLHHIPMLSFLHRASLMQRYHSGLLDRSLLLSLIGITTLLVDSGLDAKELGENYVNQAEAQILSDLEKPSTVKVQALVFIIKHRLLSRRFSSAFMLLGIASRLAAVLRLNHEQPDLCFLAQESRRRLMWALYMMDAGVAGGYEDFSLWSSERVKLQLPCNERNFEFDLPQITEGLVPPAQSLSEDLGNLALHVRVLWLRSKILVFGKRATRTQSTEDIAALQSGVTSLAQELDAFNGRLPASFKYNQNNLRLRMYSPRLCVFGMVHIWWRQCHMDLYRLAMPGMVEALPENIIQRLDSNFLRSCQQQCIMHANAMAEIFADMLALDTGMPVTDIDLPLCAYQSARVLHYAYLLPGVYIEILPESIETKTATCLKIVQSCCNECPAVKTIKLDLERLIQGRTSLSTSSRKTSLTQNTAEMICNTNVPSSMEEPTMSRHSLVKPMNIIDDSGIGTPPAPEEHPPEVVYDEEVPVTDPQNLTIVSASSLQFTPQEMAIIDGFDPDNGLDLDIQMRKLGDVTVQHVNGIPSTDLTSQNNAFEGALDGMNANTEAFGLNSLTWFSSEWLNANYLP